MFGGIIEAIGYILGLRWVDNCMHLIIQPSINFCTDLQIGESIAVNGVCLTVTNFSQDSFAVTVVPETLRVTNLNNLQVHSRVNLERSLKIGDRLSGHFVQGHVDATSKIIGCQKDGDACLMVEIELPSRLKKYIVQKGFICIDGISLTVVKVESTWFSVTLIPHTQVVTIAQYYHLGSMLNLEVDLYGKYIEKIVESSYDLSSCAS